VHAAALGATLAQPLVQQGIALHHKASQDTYRTSKLICLSLTSDPSFSLEDPEWAHPVHARGVYCYEWSQEKAGPLLVTLPSDNACMDAQYDCSLASAVNGCGCSTCLALAAGAVRADDPACLSFCYALSVMKIWHSDGWWIAYTY
jgi:hypothetical protein